MCKYYDTIQILQKGGGSAPLESLLRSLLNPLLSTIAAWVMIRQGSWLIWSSVATLRDGTAADDLFCTITCWWRSGGFLQSRCWWRSDDFPLVIWFSNQIGQHTNNTDPKYNNIRDSRDINYQTSIIRVTVYPLHVIANSITLLGQSIYRLSTSHHSDYHRNKSSPLCRFSAGLSTLRRKDLYWPWWRSLCQIHYFLSSLRRNDCHWSRSWPFCRIFYSLSTLRHSDYHGGSVCTPLPVLSSSFYSPS